MYSRPIKKYCDYYYQVTKNKNGYGWVIYNSYSENREVLEQSDNEEICDTITEAEQDAKDAISYHYV